MIQLQLQYITIFIPISSCLEAFSTHFFQCGAQSTSSCRGRWGVWVDSNPCRTDDQSCTLTTRLHKSPYQNLCQNICPLDNIIPDIDRYYSVCYCPPLNKDYKRREDRNCAAKTTRVGESFGMVWQPVYQRETIRTSSLYI